MWSFFPDLQKIAYWILSPPFRLCWITLSSFSHLSHLLKVPKLMKRVRWRSHCDGAGQPEIEEDEFGISVVHVLCRHGNVSILTAHTTRLLVGVVAAAITARANDGGRTASPITAPPRTIQILVRPRGSEQAPKQRRDVFRVAQMGRFIAAVFARDAWITELVFGQALAAVAAECSFRAAESEWNKACIAREISEGFGRTALSLLTFPISMSRTPIHLRRPDIVSCRRRVRLATHISHSWRRWRPLAGMRWRQSTDWPRIPHPKHRCNRADRRKRSTSWCSGHSNGIGMCRPGSRSNRHGNG